MPYLIKVGPERYLTTKSGQPVFASRAYWVFRRGCAVVKRFGGIRVTGAKRNRIELKHGWNQLPAEVFNTPGEAAVRVKKNSYR